MNSTTVVLVFVCRYEYCVSKFLQINPLAPSVVPVEIGLIHFSYLFYNVIISLHNSIRPSLKGNNIILLDLHYGEG